MPARCRCCRWSARPASRPASEPHAPPPPRPSARPIIGRPMRSLTLPPGLRLSILAPRRATAPEARAMRPSSISGVPPTVGAPPAQIPLNGVVLDKDLRLLQIDEDAIPLLNAHRLHLILGHLHHER